ncbi:hypothetical protein PILCRDRAFT_16200 [Piloderma croceum F 1598]|uniref:Uncharacterized protein n=1 Tax=Piloderma croceum (strain F 1598) TaxID=765440 RepID=A0A0C3EI76_PILCF|nr:hypothetical protein PILCRDRAFT_16200 [Piloderma croceum F 1598]
MTSWMDIRVGALSLSPGILSAIMSGVFLGRRIELMTCRGGFMTVPHSQQDYVILVWGQRYAVFG